MIDLRQDTEFSLLALAIGVTIMAILTMVAIVSFGDFTHASKMSEATCNLAIIRTGQFSYAAENDTFMECGPSPPAPAGTDGILHQWLETPNSSGEDGFALIGFKPNGAVRYQYEVKFAANRFVATAQADLDDDGVPCVLTLDNQAVGYSAPVRTPLDEF